MKILLANFARMVGSKGGLAKVACDFANNMSRRGHEVTLLYSDEKEGDFGYSIDESVACRNINLTEEGVTVKIPLSLIFIREICRVVSKKAVAKINGYFMASFLSKNILHYINICTPDVIISFQTISGKILLFDLGIKTPIIIMSHGDPYDYFTSYPDEELRSISSCNVFQVLLESYEDIISERLPGARTVCIGNVVPQFEILADHKKNKSRHTIVSVGVLESRKGQHLLVKAFRMLAGRYPDWNVELWGAPTSRSYLGMLRFLIAATGLKDRVHIRGTSSEIPKILANSDVFAFPSSSEGFSIALAEAMSAGLPVVGYRHCVSVRELIRDGETGLLCDKGVAPLAAALDRLMASADFRLRLGRNSKESIKKYAPEIIWDKWESLIKQTVARTNS